MRRAEAPYDGAAGESVAGEADDMVVEVAPRVVLRLHVHRVVVVQEMERERQYAIGALVLEIERRRAPERRQQRIPRKRTWRAIDEPLGQLERLGPGVRVEAKDEVGLHVGDVPQDHVDVVGDLLDLAETFHLPGLRLVAEGEPRLDPR